MLIDWFTVIAQIVNFLILVWLMKRFLYRPILAAIDTREERIAASLKDANMKMAEATTQRDDFQKKNQTIDEGRTAILQAAQNAAMAEGAKLLDTARQNAETLRVKLDAAMQNDLEAIRHAVTSGVRQEVFSIARNALISLASIDIDTQIARVFIDRLHLLDDKTKNQLANAWKSATEPAKICSAAALSDDQCTLIQQALNETFGLDAPVKFDVETRLVCGIEFSVNGQKLAWSVDNYMTSLNARVNDLLANAVVSQQSTEADAKSAGNTVQSA